MEKVHLPYVSGRGKTAVVVEDCISAAVVGDSDVYVGVAVLGTSLSNWTQAVLIAVLNSNSCTRP